MQPWVTFSGADHTVARHRVIALCQGAKEPIELALLASAMRTGSNRYPNMHLARGLAEVIKGAGQQVAVHLCGDVARMTLGNWLPGLLPGLHDLLTIADRIQVNLPEKVVTPENVQKIKQVLTEQIGEKPVIFQWRQPIFPNPQAGVQWLFDCSAGHGKAPENWPELPEDQVVGLAGGLGPGRVGPLVSSLDYDSLFWVDMESSLRDQEDRFNVDACHRVLEEFSDARTESMYRKWACGACGNQPPCPCTLEQDDLL